MATTAAADTSIHGEEEGTRGEEDGPEKGFEKQPPSTVSLFPSTIFVFHLGRKDERVEYGVSGWMFSHRDWIEDPIRPTPIIMEGEGVT